MKIKQDNIVGVKELRTNLDTYINRVNEGETLTVFRRSKPVFRITPIDSEDEWETVVDFTKINKNGVLASEVLKALKALHGKN